MLTRRSFLLSSLGLAFFPCPELPAWAKKAPAVRSGLFSISRVQWPPAILPNHVEFVERGLSLFTDEFGRLAVVDLKKPDNPRVIGELSGLGKKVIDFSATSHQGFALCSQESSSGDQQYMLTGVSLAPINEPSVMSQVVLQHFTEAVDLAAGADIICVGGIGVKGDNLVAVYSQARRARSSEPVLLATFTVEQPIQRLDLQDRNLVVLQTGRGTQIDYVSMFNPRIPQMRRSIKIEGEYKVMARVKSGMIIAGQSPQGPDVRAIILEPTPHAVSNLLLGNSLLIHDAAAQRDKFLVLAERGADRLVISIAADRTFALRTEETIVLPHTKEAPGIVSRIAVSDRVANIASGSAGVEVLTYNKTGWKHAFTYSIPRLPAAGVALWGDWAVLAAADYNLYDLSKPNKPTLLQTAEPDVPIKAVAGAGSFLLSLTRDGINLRKMNALREVVAAAKVPGQQLAFDKNTQKAYVLNAQEKQTTLTPVRVFSNSLVPEKPVLLPPGFRRIAVGDGRLVVAGLSDVAVFETGENIKALGTRKFENKAVRDVSLNAGYVLLTAVDRNSKGSLVILSTETKELNLIGGMDLPQDAAAVAADRDTAIVIGKSPEGKDVASVINLSSRGMPSITGTLNVIEAASAVQIRDNTAVIAGRGLELINLS